MRVQCGLDRPFLERYWTWLGAVVTGTWGFSFAYGIAVAPLVWGRAINTLVLGASAATVAWALALPVGVWWATRRSTAAFSMGFLTSVISAFPSSSWRLPCSCSPSGRGPSLLEGCARSAPTIFRHWDARATFCGISCFRLRPSRSPPLQCSCAT